MGESRGLLWLRHLLLLLLFTEVPGSGILGTLYSAYCIERPLKATNSSSALQPLLSDFYNLWCSIDVRARECSSATLETGKRSASLLHGFAFIGSRHRPRAQHLISHAFGEVATHALWLHL